ncbi:PCI domain-containing protein [Nesidiocoris tenuis]|uniref:CSN12-like protein n=1 Tax=Nesidiocoris tenuis TaxID=355587 RepID=A0ABN7ABL2_9HEMI|nr:PCI domain-containing protein [Nesidiocoris tenuis]
MSLIHYLQQVNNAWRNKNGRLLSDLLSLRHHHAKNPNLQTLDNTVYDYIDDHNADLVAAHLKCIFWLSKGDLCEAMSEHNTVMQNFIKALQYYKEENWLLPVLNSLCIDLRILAGQVDAYSSPNDSSAHKTNSTIKPREALEKAADVMMTCFRICSSDNRSSEYETKRWGMLPIVNQLFKLYFRTNRLHLMKPLIRAIDSSPLKDKFDLSQQITYRYYVGRKAMFDSEYALANENLTFAFVRCHKACTRNKRMILIYLVPLRIFLGYLPTKTALEKYDLLQLWEVSQAVRHGDAKKLSEAIETHQEFFIKNGIYLILERLRIVTYRNLFKKVYLLEKQPVVPLQDLLAALRLVDREDTTLEEANCILANLIHQGKIKGYISHSHQKVVLSKLDAFPKLSTLS